MMIGRWCPYDLWPINVDITITGRKELNYLWPLHPVSYQIFQPKSHIADCKKCKGAMPAVNIWLHFGSFGRLSCMLLTKLAANFAFCYSCSKLHSSIAWKLLREVSQLLFISHSVKPDIGASWGDRKTPSMHCIIGRVLRCVSLI